MDPNANIIFGAVIDDRLQGEIRITVIATGFTAEAQAQQQAAAKAITAGGVLPKRLGIPPAHAPAEIPNTPTPLPNPRSQPPAKPLPNSGLDIPEFLQRRRPPLR